MGSEVRHRLVLGTALAAVIALSSSIASAQFSEGPLSPGTVVNDNVSGTSLWNNPQQADSSDDSYASTSPGGSPTQFLKATSFGFSIPTTSQITGIEVDIERSSLAGTIVDSAVRIVKGGVVGTADRSLGGTWPMADAVVTYGSTSDLWGETWTPADINAAGFGAAIAVDDNLDVAAVDHISITVHYALCAEAPAAGCRTAEKSILVINDKSPDTKDKLVWKWIKGQNTSTAEFSDPLNTANYALCIYQDATEDLIGQYVVPPSASKWKPISTKGFKYIDKSLTEDGIQRIVVKASVVNKSKVIFKGKGANLDDVVPPLALPVVVQLVNSDTGICWEGEFDTLDIKKNQPEKFKGKALN